METKYGLVSYCSNIHPGEIWHEHFLELQKNVPLVKAQVSPHEKMGLGLRFANQASLDLQNPLEFETLKNWLNQENLYVFTLNGFPYGGFHNTVVKDQVHTPDWTTQDRYLYTLRLAHLLAKLLPDNLEEGGISTSPLSYKYWWKNSEDLKNASNIATLHLVQLVIELSKIESETGKWIHIDIEPEPDGILENHKEFIDWYENTLIPIGTEYLQKKGMSNPVDLIKRHIQLCFDICHFGVSYDSPATCIQQLNQKGIGIGKIQISSALRVDLRNNPQEKIEALKKYHEPVYLHQVKALLKNGQYLQYQDLDQAIKDYSADKFDEWRIHFHVPLFLANYGLLGSTQKEIIETLEVQKLNPCTRHLEIETYTWAVLPKDFQSPIHESISREINWVKALLNA
jgi:hypothetical protein